MDDPYNLQRFLDAQAPGINRILAELYAGQKTSHWMWFIFPQIRGLGQSAMSVRFAVSSKDEAAAYAAHPILGARLNHCTRLVLGAHNRSITEILGHPDDMKFHSSMTLFRLSAPQTPVFGQALDKFFAGRLDPATLRILDAA